MNILIILREKELEDLRLLLYSLYRSQSQKIDLYILNEDVSISILNDFLYFCSFLDFNSFVLNKDFISLNLKDLFSWDRISSLLPSTVSRILYLDSNIFVLQDLISFYNQDFEDKIFIGCDTKNFRFTEDFQPVQENKVLDFSVTLFNNKKNIRDDDLSDKVKWATSNLYNLQLDHPFFLQNPFFEKRLQKKAFLVKCNSSNKIKEDCKKQLGSFLQKQQEKKFLSNIICYNCKYNCAMSYTPIFNSQHLIKDVESISVACSFKSERLNFVNESGYKVLRSQLCPKECSFFKEQDSITKDIKEFLEKRHRDFDETIK